MILRRKGTPASGYPDPPCRRTGTGVPLPVPYGARRRCQRR